jgi:hypothetical protein
MSDRKTHRKKVSQAARTLSGEDAPPQARERRVAYVTEAEDARRTEPPACKQPGGFATG